MRDEAAAAAVIERLRRATHLDTSGARERRARNERGEFDARGRQALGDPAVLARARTVRDDKLARAWLEFEALTDPCDTSRADLAYLDAQR